RSVDFVEVESAGFPIFVKREVKIVRAGLVDPVFMGDRFRRSRIQVIAIHVDAVGRFASSGDPAAGIEERANGPSRFGKEQVVGEKAFDGGGTGGFVAVDSGGQVNSRGSARAGALEPEQGNSVRGSPMRGGETALAGELFEFIEPFDGGCGVP